MALSDSEQPARRREEADLAKLLAEKQPGWRAFIAAQGVCGNSTILVGRKGAFERGLVCYDGDYFRRAQALVRRYNAHVPPTAQPEAAQPAPAAAYAPAL